MPAARTGVASASKLHLGVDYNPLLLSRQPLSILTCAQPRSSFMQKASDTYRPIQHLESKQLMHDLLVDPKNFRDQLERYAASVIVMVTYGRRVHDVHKDHMVVENRIAMDVLTSVK